MNNSCNCLNIIINKKMKELLEKLTDKEEHNYIDWFVHPDYGTVECLYCWTHFPVGEEERHSDDCPILLARQLLEEMK